MYPPGLDPRHKWAPPVRSPAYAGVVRALPAAAPVAPVAPPAVVARAAEPVATAAPATPPAPVRTQPRLLPKPRSLKSLASPPKVVKPPTPSPSTPITISPDALTIRQRILLAAVSLRASDSRVFSTGRLVVRAFERYPEAFALRDEDIALDYPDSNKVLAKLSGVDGLCHLGWMASAGRSLWRVTPKGEGVAASLKKMLGEKS